MESSLKIRVVRDACCSQDDQIAPLEATYGLRSAATLADFVRAVIDSQFLQFSSTRLCLTASVSGMPLVKVCESDRGPQTSPLFFVSAETPIAPLVGNRIIEFRFT